MTPSTPLEILWDDPHLIAVSKPAGLLTQPAPGGGETLEAAVRLRLEPERPADVYLGTVQRLDRPVSGVIVWAKTEKAARRLADQFAKRKAEKVYWAIAQGRPLGLDERWEDWLGPASETGRIAIVANPAGARRAITVARRWAGPALAPGLVALELAPETGRTHQLRVQAAARGRPILGDALYGSTYPFADGIALHARRLTLIHPATLRPITIEAPLPASWLAAGLAPGGPPVVRRS